MNPGIRGLQPLALATWPPPLVFIRVIKHIYKLFYIYRIFEGDTEIIDIFINKQKLTFIYMAP